MPHLPAPRALAAILVSAALATSGCGGSSSSPGSSQMTHRTTHAMSKPVISSPAADLQVTLDQLLGEHAALAVIATQKGYDHSPDFAQTAKLLDDNSVAISKAIGSVYGAKAGDEFLNGPNMWRAHIKDFVDYTVALKTHDTAGQKAAQAKLVAYTTDFGTFLAKATGLPRQAVIDDLGMHVAQLEGQIDAYAAGDYTKSTTLLNEAYAHMFMTGNTLAAAIIKQSPSSFTGSGSSSNSM